MTVWRPWPYAATAIVQHEWDTDQLNVWLIFKYPMDQTVKPDHGLWLCEVDDVLKAITVSAWQDEWTILLTVPNVLALPGRVTLEYDGPDTNLRTTWEKQWEPWGPILSKRIPYLWEDILVVDTVNKRVGIQPGLPATATLMWALTIVSPDGNEQIGIYHDNNEGRISWSKGSLTVKTSETNAISVFILRGNGTGHSAMSLYDETDLTSFNISMEGGYGSFRLSGANPQALDFENVAEAPARFYSASSEGEVLKHRIFGWKTGDAQRRSVDCQISPNANNTALWSGVAHYVFDGDSLRTTGAMVSGTLTHSAAGPTDNLDVSGVNTVFIDCSGGDVTIGGFIGGVDGQVLNLVRLCAAVNDATLEHNEGTGNQDIFLHKGLDETLTGEYGGWTLVCNGTSWFDASHAKHV